MDLLPYSAASERNREPILEALRGRIVAGQTVLEIGAGTGQHAVYFAGALQSVRWLPTDTPSAFTLSRQRIAQAALPNLAAPRPLDVTATDWHEPGVDAVYSANTAHIMSWTAVEAMFRGVGKVLGEGGFFLYGPFNRNGEFTSPGNADFHRSLQSRDPRMGIRDDADLVALAAGCGLVLSEDLEMPANNRLLVWRRALSHSDGASAGT